MFCVWAVEHRKSHHIEGVDAPERMGRRPATRAKDEVGFVCVGAGRLFVLLHSLRHSLVPQTPKKNVYNARTIDDYRHVTLTGSAWKTGKPEVSTDTRTVFGVSMSKVRELSPKRTSPGRRSSGSGFDFKDILGTAAAGTLPAILTCTRHGSARVGDALRLTVCCCWLAWVVERQTRARRRSRASVTS